MTPPLPLRLAPTPSNKSSRACTFAPRRAMTSAMSDRELEEKEGGDRGFDLLGALLDEADAFQAHVLPLLSVKEHFALAGVNRACRDALAEVEGMVWLRTKGKMWSAQGTARFQTGSVQRDACRISAEEGRLEVLKWLRAHGCEWDERTCAWAAEGGHLDVLQWARENGCQWYSGWVCSAAAEGRNLEMLQWLKQNGCPEADHHLDRLQR